MMRFYACALIALVACERSAADRADGGGTRATDASSDGGAGIADATTPALDTLLDRKIVSLTASESRVLCEASAARTDVCLSHAFVAQIQSLGVLETSEEQCTSALDACRSQPEPPSIDCAFADYYNVNSSCSVTVQEYLGCVAAYNKRISCLLAGMPLPVLKECLPLIRDCPMLGLYGSLESYIEPCDAANAPVRVDDDDDIRGLDVCRPRPARMAALGDSIASCLLADLDGTDCAPDLIASYVREHVAPDLEYTNYAESGALTADWRTQAEMVPTGPGHLLLWVYLGGNDIIRCGQFLDAASVVTCVDGVISDLASEWMKIFEFFTDKARFPDGVTFLLNTQYALRDECDVPGDPPGGATRDAKLKQYNQALYVKFAEMRDDTIAIDQYSDWLGHGKHADDQRCPHCNRDDNTRWLANDNVHPNSAGQRHIADKWKVAIDAIYGRCD